MSDIIAHTIADAARVSGLGRTTLYGLLGAGKLAAIKSGSKTLIPAESLRLYLATLPKAVIRTGQKRAV